MDRFEDDVREKERAKCVVLSDGREFTHKHIFDTFRQSRFKEGYMKEAMYRLIVGSTFKIEVSNDDPDREIDIESFMRKSVKPKKSEEVKLEVNGIDSNSPEFYSTLENVGETVYIK